LFDISQTNLSDRRGLLEETFDHSKSKQRNQQRNFETIIQVVSLRSQPENITTPLVVSNAEIVWGNNYVDKHVTAWQFTFIVSQRGVFYDGKKELGHLLNDCQYVPMITDLDESVKLQPQLNTTEEMKNIHFEVIDHDG
jgi:hypothetical protein